MASTKDKQVKPEQNEPRRHTNKFLYIGTVILLVITIVAFVFVPATGSMDSGGELTFGSWNGKPIAFVQGGIFQAQVQQIKAQLESQGYKDTGDQFFAYQVWRRAFDNTAIHLALLDRAQSAGIDASESYIDAQMIKNPAFSENGTFSKRRYREASNAVKLALRKEIKENTLKNRYVSDVTSFIASKAETDFLTSLASSQRSIEYVAFAFADYPDSERIAFAKANPSFFKQVRLSRVTMTSSRKDTEQVLEKVKSGSLSFEEAAKNHSKDSYASKGGDMGAQSVWQLKGELKSDADLEAVISLAKGQLSAVYETLAGSWIFFRVDETPTEPDFASAELLRSVSDYLNRNEKGRIEDWIVAKADSFAQAASTDFASAAAKAGYPVKTTKPFPLNYGKALDVGYFSLLGALDTTDLVELRGADSNERFLTSVFSLPAGGVSKPVVINDYAIVLRVKEILDSKSDEAGLLAMYYPTIIQQNVSSELAEGLLKDPKLKDDFVAAFSKVYAQSN
jgi:peptidyl-prolyl cis-trans isomerase D